jgi:uncharacterized membrane protein (DUF106 family)
MAIVGPVVEISLVAVAVVVASRFLQSMRIDKEKQKAAQTRMKEKQAKIKELMKQGDEKSKGEMQRLQKEMFEEMSESMQGSMRYMLFSLPLFFGAFFVLGHFYGGTLFEAPFLVPKFENFFFLNPLTWVPVDWVLQTGWLKWYFITYLITSIFLGIILKIKEKATAGRKE